MQFVFKIKSGRLNGGKVKSATDSQIFKNLFSLFWCIKRFGIQEAKYFGYIRILQVENDF